MKYRFLTLIIVLIGFMFTYCSGSAFGGCKLPSAEKKSLAKKSIPITYSGFIRG